MKKIFLLLLTLVSMQSFAADLDVLIAKTAIALGDEYSSLATKYQKALAFEQENSPFELVSSSNREKYESFKELALNEYELVFCNSECPQSLPENGIELGTVYSYLRAEAISKYALISRGSNSHGTIGKYSTIYAVNSNFEEHLLNRVRKMIENQQTLDSKARELSQTLNQLNLSTIDNETLQIQGVDQQIISSSNYSNDTQVQVSSYNSCISSETIQSEFEAEEVLKSMAQIDQLQKSMFFNLDSIFDYKYTNEASDINFKVHANFDWMDTGIELPAGGLLNFSATGSWIVRGGADVFVPTLIYFGSNSMTGTGFYVGELYGLSNIWGSLNTGWDATSYVLGDPRYISQIGSTVQQMANKIKMGAQSTPEGYIFSFSSGLSWGESYSTGSSSGISVGFIFGFNEGQSGSSSNSSGVSEGLNGTWHFKMINAVVPEFPIGSLIGSFCPTNPSESGFCLPFLIGAGTAENVPTAPGYKLWLRANDVRDRAYLNKGSVNVQIRRSETFATYLNQFVDWYDQECDVNGENCGFGILLENIAYSPNPYTIAKSYVTSKFPSFPDAVINILLSHVNKLIELKIALKEVKSKEISRSLHDSKIALCKEQLAETLKKIKSTQDLIATYENVAQNVESKRIILDTSRRFYESELAALNTLRSKNLERIKRYYALTINSYNYLYLDDFKTEAYAQDYFEGDFYASQIDMLEDLILEITSVNDLLNPNRGFVVYQLSKDELAPLLNKDYRKRNTQISLTYNDFTCQGFNIENQARVMIDKVGVLLDIDPAKEHLFFKNSNQRQTQFQLIHGLENQFYDFNGIEKEFWMPAQKRNVAGHSSRILMDANADYFQLRDSRFFERLSFRKTSLASTWQIDMKDPAIRMYDPGDVDFTNPYLKGVKLVFWFNSSEIQNENLINKCLISPYNLTASSNPTVGTDLNWNFSTSDDDYRFLERFTIYRSTSEGYGFKPIAHIPLSECSEDEGILNCNFTDSTPAEGGYFYEVRSSYKPVESSEIYRDGVPSEPVTVTSKK